MVNLLMSVELVIVLVKTIYSKNLVEVYKEKKVTVTVISLKVNVCKVFSQH